VEVIQGKITHKLHKKLLANTAYTSQTHEQKYFIISEVAADRHQQQNCSIHKWHTGWLKKVRHLYIYIHVLSHTSESHVTLQHVIG